MLRHADVWRAIDRLAAQKDLSPSGLAKKAGLDATSFNKSKRITPDGKHRWPSMESIAKILAVTNSSVEEFSELLTLKKPTKNRVPMISTSKLTKQARASFTEAGAPVVSNWDGITFPDPDAFAVELSAPFPPFAENDIVIVSPSSELRKGDDFFAYSPLTGAIVGTLLRQTADTIEYKSGRTRLKAALSSLTTIGRITWVSR